MMKVANFALLLLLLLLLLNVVECWHDCFCRSMPTKRAPAAPSTR